MIENGLVTIVIPCYNQAHFLPAAIGSILAQSYKNYEVIVVNDGSTDKTSEVTASFHTVQLIEQDNMGLSAARNAGLQKSRGEFIVFLDADDRLRPEALEIGVNCLKDHPDCVFVSGVCNRITVDGSLIPTNQPIVEGEDYYQALLKFNYIWAPSNVMYRRTVFEQAAGFDGHVNPAADYELYLRLARLFPVYHHGRIVTEYRQHSAAMSRNYAEMLKHVLIVLHSQREFVNDRKAYREALKQGILWYKEYYLEAVGSQVIGSLKNGKLIRGIRQGKILLFYPRVLPGLMAKFVRNRLGRKAMV